MSIELPHYIIHGWRFGYNSSVRWPFPNRLSARAWRHALCCASSRPPGCAVGSALRRCQTLQAPLFPFR